MLKSFFKVIKNKHSDWSSRAFNKILVQNWVEKKFLLVRSQIILVPKDDPELCMARQMVEQLFPSDLIAQRIIQLARWVAPLLSVPRSFQLGIAWLDSPRK